MKMKKRLIAKALIKISFILLLAIVPLQLSAEVIQFRLQPGFTYEYLLTVTSSNKSQALSSTFTSATKPEAVSFRLNVIDFQEKAFIVDISSSGQVFRRYIKENGTISGAPAEAGQQVPFFLSLPENDWQPGQRHSIDGRVSIGRQSFSASWQLLLKAIDKEKETAEILFNSVPSLPPSKLARRKFSLKGRMIFNLQQGTVSAAEWVCEYHFQLQNKEIAITRNLWALSERTVYNLKLVNIEEQ